MYPVQVDVSRQNVEAKENSTVVEVVSIADEQNNDSNDILYEENSKLKKRLKN